MRSELRLLRILLAEDKLPYLLENRMSEIFGQVHNQDFFLELIRNTLENTNIYHLKIRYAFWGCLSACLSFNPLQLVAIGQTRRFSNLSSRNFYFSS